MRSTHATLALLCGILLLGWLPLAQGQTYYVSTGGNDSSGDGSPGNRWRTIQHCANIATAGATCVVAPGTYQERVSFPNSGISGAPITFTGENTGEGQVDSIIDPSSPLGGWVEDAGACGSGCYRASPAFKVYWLGEGDKDIMRMEGFQSGGTDMLNRDPDSEYFSYYTNSYILWWEGFEALWVGTGTPTGTPPAYTTGADPGNVWIRYRNRDNPNSKNLRASGGGFGQTVDFSNRSWITFRHFKVQGGAYAVWLSNSNNIILEDNEIKHGMTFVRVQNSSHHITIRRNTIHSDHIQGSRAYLPGAFNNFHGWPTDRPAYGSPQYDAAVREKYYFSLKNYTQQTISETIQMADVNTIEIANNLLYDSNGDVVSFIRADNLDIHHNTMHACSSVAVMPIDSFTNVYVHDNLLYDCNILIRFLQMDQGAPMQQAYIYRNRLWNPRPFGNTIYFAALSNSGNAVPHDVWLYHNSMEDDMLSIGISVDLFNGIRNVYFVNNIISSWKWTDANASLGDFGYNWIVGTDPTTIPFGGPGNTLNIVAANTGEGFWNRNSMPDFVIPPGHPAHNTGIDLSQTFTIGATTHGALPGMAPDYGMGLAPDPGANVSGGGGGTIPEGPSTGPFYIATTGTDAQDCTAAKVIGTPRRWFRNVAPCMAPSATVYWRGGTYAESISTTTTPIAPGVLGSPTLLSAYNHEVVVLKPSSNVPVFAFDLGAGDHHVTLSELVIDSDSAADSVGIVVHSGSHHLSFVSGECLESHFECILLQGASDILIAYSVLHHTDAGVSNNEPVSIDGGSNITLQSNDIHHSGSHGIAVQGGATGVRIEGNTPHDNAGAGIFVGSSTAPLLANNGIYANSVGVEVATGASGAKVYHNDLFGNTNQGVKINAGATNTLLTNDSFSGNGSPVSDAGTSTVQTTNLLTPVYTAPGPPAEWHKVGVLGTTVAEVTTDAYGVGRLPGQYSIGLTQETIGPPDVSPPTLSIRVPTGTPFGSSTKGRR
jgi:parallel beta-helix repeat protein